MANDKNPKFNPYASPSEIAIGDTNLDTDAVAVRKAHLSHEASVQSFGCLYFLGATFLLIGGVVILITGISEMGNAAPADPDFSPVFFLVLGPIYILVSGLQFWVATGLRSLTKVGRIGGTIFGILGLAGIPIGTLISAYLLYLLWSKKGTMVFSERYREVIEATPEIKYKTSIVVWVLLGLVLLLVGFGIVAAIMQV